MRTFVLNNPYPITSVGPVSADLDDYVMNPMHEHGDIIYGGNAGYPTRLGGNTTTTRKFLEQTGDGTVAGHPSWGIPSYVPYTGATGGIDLGAQDLTTTGNITGNFPIATKTTLGVMIAGSNLTVDVNGVVNGLPGGGEGSTVWGPIGGDIDDQVDLREMFLTKAPKASPTFTGNVTMPGTGIWNSLGKVGIGTAIPVKKLQVNGDIFLAGANGIYFGEDTLYSNTAASIRNIWTSADNQGLAFYTGYGTASERMRIVAISGNVGIGFTAPLSALCINGGLHVGGESAAGDDNLLVEGTSIFGTDLSSVTFASGFAGSGWKNSVTTGEYTLTVDNLVVRKALTAYELDINKINSVNGGIVVSVANGTCLTVSGTTIYMDEDAGNKLIQFTVDDYVRAQIWTGRGIASYVGKVTAVNHSNTYGVANIVATTISGTPFNGMELVQIGNSSDTARQNLIYITASDTNNPYIDMLAGVNAGSFSGKQKLRIGNLSGITDAAFGGALSGYGLYANNIYLKGQIIIANPGDIDQTSLANSAAAGAQVNTIDAGDGLAALDSTASSKLTGIAEGADVTSANTAAGIVGQGTLATLSSVDFATQVGGATKPANNATVGAIWGGAGANISSIPSYLNTTADNALALTATYIGFHATGSNWPIRIMNDGGVGKFYIGNGTDYVDWNGSTLAIKGGITITSGVVGGFNIDPTEGLYIGTGATRVQMKPGAGFWTGADTFAAAPFSASPAGALKATLGSIGGFTIASTTLTGGNAVLSNTGVLTLGTGNDVAIISAADATYRLWAGNTNPVSASFSVTKAGALTAKGVVEFGTGTANYGSGLDWNIAMIGSDIWENTYYGDGSILYINRKSQNGGFAYYRDTYIMDGRNHPAIRVMPFDARNGMDPIFIDILFGSNTGYPANLYNYGTLYVKEETTLDSSLTVGGAFGCNGKTAQSPFVSGLSLSYTSGTYGLNTSAQLDNLMNTVAAIRQALVANGIMSFS